MTRCLCTAGFVLALIAPFFSQVFASEGMNKDSKTTDLLPRKTKKTVVQDSKSAAADSRDNRKGKTASLLGEVVGFTMTPLYGARVEYFLTQNFLGEISYTKGQISGFGFERMYSKQLLEAKMKYFLGNSFYVDAGFGMETWSFSYDVSGNGAVDPEKRTPWKILDGSLTNSGIVFHLGNQWQWPFFTIGCDWVGYFWALSTKTKFSKDAEVDRHIKTEKEDTVKHRVDGDSFHLLRLYLGVSF